MAADSSDGESHHWMALNNRAPIAAHIQNLVPLDSPAAQGLALEIGSGSGAQLELLAERQVVSAETRIRPKPHIPSLPDILNWRRVHRPDA